MTMLPNLQSKLGWDIVKDFYPVSLVAQFPDVPTVSASGLAGFEFNSWFAVMAPVGTPKDIVNRLNAGIVKALADPEVRANLIAQGLKPGGSSAAARSGNERSVGEVCAAD